MAQAVTHQLSRDPALDECVNSVFLFSRSAVGVVFRPSWEAPPALFGVHVSEEHCAPDSPLRIAGSSPEEVAFDIVHVAISEPRDVSDFGLPDSAGVRWLPVSAWGE